MFGGRCTKTRNPGIGTVLHWQRPDVNIVGTDPSLVISDPDIEVPEASFFMPQRYQISGIQSA